MRKTLAFMSMILVTLLGSSAANADQPSSTRHATPSFATPSFATPSFATPSFATPSFATPSFATLNNSNPPQSIWNRRAPVTIPIW
jgi:hypothetical protein